MQKNFIASDKISVLEANHGFNLGVAHGHLPRLELALKGLQSHNFSSYIIFYLIDDTKGALTKHFKDLESFNEYCTH